MKSKIIVILSVIFIMSAILSGCTIKDINGTSAPTATVDFQSQLKSKDDKIATMTTENETLKKQIKSLKSSTTLNLALTIVTLLKNKDMTGLSNYIHPVKGVRFSPYASVNMTADLTFNAAQIAAFFTDTVAHTWGTADGSGLPISLSTTEYYDKFVYDVDFADPDMLGLNNEIGKGNTPNNIATAYPGDEFVEFHFTGFDPQYAGLDWKSLRLVFEDVGGTLFLVGIIHAQWTI